MTNKMTANEALDSYLRSLDQKVLRAKSRDIRALCQISRSVLYDWRKCRSQISADHRAKITEAIGKNIFENVEN